MLLTRRVTPLPYGLCVNFFPGAVLRFSKTGTAVARVFSTRDRSRVSQRQGLLRSSSAIRFFKLAISASIASLADYSLRVASITPLRPNGLLVVDDMDLAQHADDPQLTEQLAELTEKLLDDPRLICVECPISSGVILATRKL